MTGGLSAAATISAAIRGDCSEEIAAQWHSNKITESYARFLIVVLSAYKQILNQQDYVLSDFGENNFDRTFNFFKPSRFISNKKLSTQDSNGNYSHSRNSRYNQQAYAD